MAYWLIKTEPGTWSWQDQLDADGKTTEWDGVKNHLANKHMKAMKKGKKKVNRLKAAAKARAKMRGKTKTMMQRLREKKAPGY